MRTQLFLALVAASVAPTLALADLSATSSGPAPGLYVGGESGTPTVVSLLNSARSTIDIEIYTMGNLQVRQAIRAALHRKVRVRIIKDSAPVSEACSVFPRELVNKTGGVSASQHESPNAPKPTADCEDQRHLVAEVNSSGGAYVPYNKPALCRDNSVFCFQHGKIAIVDSGLPGAAALVSTGNFDDTNLCDASARPSHCDRDYNWLTRDASIIHSLSAVFQKDLLGQKYDLQSMLNGTVSKWVTVSPFSLPPLLAFLKSARQSVQIQEQYLKDADIVQALIELAKSGKQVSIQVASACAFGKPQGKDVEDFQKTYSAFEEAGAKVRIYSGDQLVSGRPGYLHAKAILVDGSIAWVGSVNASETSLTNNREFGVFISDGASISKLRQQMAHDFQDSRSETWQESLDCVKDPL